MIDFFIIGVQKAATSSLATILNSSKDVYLPKDEKTIFLTEAYLDVELLNFEKELGKQVRAKKVGIKCPDYFSSTKIAKRIFRHNKEAKFIIISRPPVDRFVSAAYWYMQIGLIPIEDINTVVQKAVGDEQSVAYRQLLYYGMYSKSLHGYLECFDSASFFHAFQHELKDDPNMIVKRVSEFLGISIDLSSLIESNSTKKKQSIYSPARLKFLAFLNKNFFYRLEYIEDSIYPHLRQWPLRLIYYIGIFVDKYTFSRISPEKKPQLTNESKKILNDLYSDDYANFLESFSD